jgi:integrase
MARRSRASTPRAGGHAYSLARDLSQPEALPGPRKAASKRVEYRDLKVRRLSLRLGVTGGAGTGQWTWRYRSEADGKTTWRRIVLGNYPSMRYAEAVNAISLSKEDKQTGTDPAAAKAARAAERAARLTFRELVDEKAVPYFETKKRPRDPINLLRRLAVPAIGHMAVEDITSADIERLIEGELNRLRKAGKKGTQANALRAVLSTTFGLAKRRSVVRDAEFGEPLPHGTPKELAFEQPDDAAQFMAGVEAAMPRNFALALKLILLTGSRPLEIMSLRRSNYVADHLVPNVAGGRRQFSRTPALKWSTTKNGRSHLIPLSRQANAIVTELLASAGGESDSLLFPSAKKPSVAIRPTRLANEMQAARPTLGLPENFSPHCLRKSAATLIEALGFGRHVADLTLNHVAKDVTGRHYSMFKHLPEVIEALQLLADMVAPDAETAVHVAEVVAFRGLSDIVHRN